MYRTITDRPSRLFLSIERACILRKPEGHLMPRDRDPERRRRRRFPLRFDFRWRSLATEEEGQGETIDISSLGILFAAEHEFLIGERILLSINWPVRLDCQHPLRLVVEGKAVRRQEDGTAIEIGRYEFRLGKGLELTLRKGPAGMTVRDWWVSLRKESGSS